MKTSKSLILFFLLFSLLGNKLTAQGLIVINDDKQVIDLTSYTNVYEDKSNQLSIQAILTDPIQSQFRQVDKPALSFGFSQSSFWLKTKFIYNGKSNLALQIKNVLLDSIQVYIVENNKVIEKKQAGLLIPFSERDVNINYYIFDLLTIQKSTCEMYIKINSKLPIEVLASLGEKEYFMEENIINKFFHGIYFGFVLLIILYNLFIYTTIKDIGYLLYVFSCFCLGLSFLVNYGYLYQFIYPAYPFVNLFINYINITCFTIIANIVFAMQFLRIRRYFNFSYYLAIGLIVLLFLLIILNLIGYTAIAYVSSQLILLLIACLGVSVPYYIYKQGFKPAIFFLLAWAGIILGGVIDILKANEFLPINDFTNNSYRIGTAWEMLLLSFALADKINVYKEDRIKAKEENLVLVQTNLELAEKNIYLVKEQNAILAEKVKERTAELQSANREILEQNEELHTQERELMMINQELISQKEYIEAQNKELKNTSYRLNTSIRYAQHIQNIILSDSEKLNSFFEENFIIYLPKDIVSGDFYWFEELSWDKKWKKENQVLLQSINPDFLTNKAVLAMIDCTGHGVPGAFMTMIVHTLLHEIVGIKKISNPAFILQNLHTGIKNLLKQHESKNIDGMDMCICYFEKDEMKKEYQVTFASAKGIAFYVHGNEIIQFSGERYSIGGSIKKERRFTNQIVTLPFGTMLYLASDGYIDQNNADRVKFGSSNFKALLSKIHTLPIQEQHEEIINTLNQHTLDEEQRDDISVVGIKL